MQAPGYVVDTATGWTVRGLNPDGSKTYSLLHTRPGRS